MNPNFRLRGLNARTLRFATRAIAPIEPHIEHLDTIVLQSIELQLRCFPFWHRFGFLCGLHFLELGGPLGGWGVTPFSLLSRARAQRRFQSLMASRFAPVRLFCHGLKVLVCLSVYGHSDVESHYGFPRRAWRKNRARFRETLLAQSRPSTPKTPTALLETEWIEESSYLSWEATQALIDQTNAVYKTEKSHDQHIEGTPDTSSQVGGRS